MRKVFILVAALLLVGTFAFAQSFDWEYEADASATWGVQLDEMTTGFKNAASFTLSSTLREESTEEWGEGQMYGWIEVEDIEVTIDSDNQWAADLDGDGEDEKGGALSVSFGDITGRVIFGAAYVELTSNVAEVDKASNTSRMAFDIISLDDTVLGVTGGADLTAFQGATNLSNDPFVAPWGAPAERAGALVGFEVPGLATVELGIASRYAWGSDVDTPNAENAYAFSIDAEVTPVDMVTVGLVSNMQFGNKDEGSDGTLGTLGNPAALGFSFEYDMPLSADMNLVPEVGVDATFMEDGAEDMLTTLEFGAGVNVVWPGIGTDEDDQDYFGAEDVETTSGVGLGGTFGIWPVDKDESVNVVGVKVSAFEDSGDDGLLPIVGGAVILNYNTILKNEDIGIEDPYNTLGAGLEVNADLGVVSPFFGFIYEAIDVGDNYNTDGALDQAFLNVGTDIDVIANTTFTLEYASGNLLYDEDNYGGADPTWGYTYSTQGLEGGRSAAQAGALWIKTEVSF
jgi:hypothetical protein